MEIPKTMQAVVIHGIEDYRLEEVPVPTPGEDEVLVKVLAVGICAGDAKTFVGATRFWGNGADIPAYVEPPIIPGHEFSGRVVASGPGGLDHHGVAIGDLVVSEQIVPCQECLFCKKGEYQMCLPHDVYGFHQVTPGAMAGYMIFPRKARVHKVPSHVPPHHACFVEPLAIGLHVVEKANMGFTDVVVVSGCGPIGLSIIAGAKLKSPKLIVGLDLADRKLELAKKTGADVVLNPTKCNLEEEIKKLTDGYGCDIYIEATGAPASVKQGLNCLIQLGKFIEVSVFAKEVSADWSIISDTKELTIIGCHLGPYVWPKAIDMVANGQLPTEDIISHQLPLKDFLKGIKMVCDGRDSIKVMLIPE